MANQATTTGKALGHKPIFLDQLEPDEADALRFATTVNRTDDGREYVLAPISVEYPLEAPAPISVPLEAPANIEADSE